MRYLLASVLLLSWNSSGVVSSPCAFVDQVALGGEHGCATNLANKQLVCWGENSNGAIIPEESNTSIHPDSPSFVSLVVGDEALDELQPRFRSFSSGKLATCYAYAAAELSDGLRCWGRLGKSDVSDEYKTLSGLVEHVSIGATVGCYVLEGSLYCWGDNVEEIGFSKQSVTFEESEMLVAGGAKFVAVGGRHVCTGRNSPGTAEIFCWGCATCEDQLEVLGYSAIGDIGKSPVTAITSPSEIKKMVAGLSHTCILFKNGEVKCFGSNEFGQLGLFGKPTNTVVDFGIDYHVKDIASGDNFVCAWLADQNDKFEGIKCWGENEARQLGVDDTRQRGDLANDAGDNLPFVQGLKGSFPFDDDDSATGPNDAFGNSLSLGSRSACILSLDNRDVYCWGAFGDKFMTSPTLMKLCVNQSTPQLGLAETSIIVVVMFGVASCVWLAVMVRKFNHQRETLPLATTVNGDIYDLSEVLKNLNENGIDTGTVIDALSMIRHNLATVLHRNDTIPVRKTRIEELVRSFRTPQGESDEYFVFISHATKDSEFTRSLAREVSEVAAAPVFWDLGTNFESLENLSRLVESSTNFVFYLTDDSITSYWCIFELITAHQHGIKVFPVIMEKFDFARLSATIREIKDKHLEDAVL